MSDEREYRKTFRRPGYHAGEVDAEFRFHLDARIAELIAGGLPPDAARTEALRRFGDVEETRRYCERTDRMREARMRRTDYLRQLGQDLAYALRTLRKAPGFTIVALLTLALGIGANTGVFSVVYGILLRPLPYGQSEQVTALTFQEGYSVSKSRLAMLRERQRAFDGIAAYSRWGTSLTGTGDPEILRGAVGTANLFEVLRARAAIGRVFHAGEDQPGNDGVVVLGHALWVQRFGADSSIVGRPVTMDGRQRVVIGVMPAGFDFPVHGTQFWTPTVLNPTDSSDYVAGYLLLVARMHQGTSVAAASADLRLVVDELRAANLGGFTDKDENSARALPIRDSLVGRLGPRLALLFGAAGLVLLIACANVANLLLARGVDRGREFAVRVSVGATRARLLRQVLTESVLLSLLGGLLGVAAARVVSGLIGGLIPADALGSDTTLLGLPAFAFTLGASLLVGVAFGIMPALRSSLADTSGALRTSRATRGRSTSRLMRGLVVAECAVAFVLAIAASLLVQSFTRLNAEDPGFQPEGVLSFRVEPPERSYSTPESQRELYDAMLQRLQATPGVTAAAAIQLLPLGDGNWNPSLLVEKRTLASDEQPPEIDWRVVTTGYLATMHIPLLRGRWFTDADRDGTPLVTVINEVTARRDFPGADPIGQRVRTFFEGRGNWATIIGVVGSTKDQSLAGPARPQMYRPFAQHPGTGMAVLVRGTGDPMALAEPARQAVWSVDHDIPIADVRPLERVVQTSIAEPRTLTLLFSYFGVLALLLGIVGIYGVVAYTVSQRAFEFGLRRAFGADGSDVVRLVLRDALGMAVLGVGVGVVASIGLGRFLGAQLYGVAPTDPVTYVVGAVILLAVAVASSLLPARRAVAADPTVAIRNG